MANLALGIQNNAPHDPLRPSTASVPSSFAVALDSVSSQLSSFAIMSLNVEIT
jgi:hypothetical protein